MYKDSQAIIPYNEIDYEIRELCQLLNSIDGIETVESCCGHNERPCCIFCRAETPEALTFLMFNFFDCERLWKLNLDLADVHKDWKDIHFVINSGDLFEYPVVNLMIDNLTYRFKTILLKKNDNEMF